MVASLVSRCDHHAVAIMALPGVWLTIVIPPSAGQYGRCRHRVRRQIPDKGLWTPGNHAGNMLPSRRLPTPDRPFGSAEAVGGFSGAGIGPFSAYDVHDDLGGAIHFTPNSSGHQLDERFLDRLLPPQQR